MTKIYAITGGIGSGKSTVCKIIKELGFTVFSADKVYKELLKCPEFVAKIYTALGIESDNFREFNTKLVAEKVFNNKELLKKLNDVTHPEVMRVLLEKSKKINGVCFNEVPLLFESGYQDLYDGVIVVKRDINLRKRDVLKRDKITEGEFYKRVENQFNYENLSNFAHTVIANDESYEQLTLKVKAVLGEIIKN